MKLHAETRGLDGPLPGGQAGAAVTVEPILSGTMQVPPVYLRSPKGEVGLLKLALAARRGTVSIPCVAFLVRHPGAGPILIDTGLHASAASDPKENFGRLGAVSAKPALASGEDVPSQLRRRGVDPGSVRTIVLTHLHTDHASGIAEFPNATFVLSRAEWEAAGDGVLPARKIYHRPQFDYAFDFRTIDFQGGSVSSYATFGRTVDLLGDGSVRLAFTPGHTLGHQSVILRLADRDLIVAGDAFFLTEQLEEERADLPARIADRHNFRRSLQELRLYHRQYPDVVITPGHDADFYAAAPERWQ